jgi:hypothetical protein
MIPVDRALADNGRGGEGNGGEKGRRRMLRRTRLFSGVLLLVLGFGSSESLATAYSDAPGFRTHEPCRRNSGD